MIDLNTDKNDPQENDPHGNDTEWRAFRYVLGEMSPAEADAFEEILATDQATRELVAQSTWLVTNLLVAESAQMAGARNGSSTVITAELSPTVVRPASSPKYAARKSGRDAVRQAERFNAWAVTGLAAAVCCCVAIGLCLIPLSGPSSLDEAYSADLTDNGAGHLVAIWSQRLADSATELTTAEPAASERSELPLSGDSDDSRVATATPGWMLAAVEGGEGQKSDGTSPGVWE
jgi:hypothetical protein